MRDAAHAVRLAPIEVLLGLTVAAAFSWAVEVDDGDAFRRWAEIAIVCGLAGAAAWIGTTLHALGQWKVRGRWAVILGGLVLAVSYGVLVLRLDHAAEAWRAGTLLALALMAILAAPAFASAAGTDPFTRFRRLNLRFVTRSIGVGLYGAALFAGLALAIGAVNSLFELQVEGDIYGHVFGAIAFALIPWVVVGGLPDLTRPLGTEIEVSTVVRRFAAYLVIPLLVVYYCILYAYSVRIALTGELPSNLVSPLVLAAGVLALLAVTLFETSKAVRWSPPLFLPLGALGIWALGIRIGQYGWTEFRYLRTGVLVVFVVLALAGAIQVVRRRRLPVHFIPLALAAFLVLAAVGPWSAPAVSGRSQEGRLVEGLTNAGLLEEDEGVVSGSAIAAAAGRRVPNETYEAIRTTALYLTRHFGREEVAARLPPNFLAGGGGEGTDEVVYDLPARIGLVADDPLELDRVRFARLEEGAAVSGLRGGTAYRISLPRGGVASNRAGDGITVRIAPDSSSLRIDVDGERLTASLESLVEWLARGTGAAVDPAPPPARPSRPGAEMAIPPARALIDLVDSERRLRGQLLVQQIGLRARPEGGRVWSLEAILILAGR